MAAAKGELDRKHQQFKGLVKPLSSGYGKLNPQIEQLTAQVRSVTAETAKLSGALSDSRQVGLWARYSFAASSNWPGWPSTATSLSSRPAMVRVGGPTWW